MPVHGSEELTIQAHDLTDAHTILGTAGYMAPEQVTGRMIDFRADQFALGAILYEMVTGARAFKRDTPVQTMAAVVEADPKLLFEAVSNLLDNAIKFAGRGSTVQMRIHANPVQPQLVVQDEWHA